MDWAWIIVLLIVLYFIIYSAVSSAIKPLHNKNYEINLDEQNLSLVKLRDMKIFNENELNDVIKLYKKKAVKKEVYEQYERYLKVLDELKEMKYLSDEEYNYKVMLLKEHFNVD